MLEWIAIPFSRGSSQPRDQTWVSCIGRQTLYHLSHQGSPSFICLFFQILSPYRLSQNIEHSSLCYKVGPYQLFHTWYCLVAKSCMTLCNPMNDSPPGSSVHGISQARILQWVAISPFRGSSQPKDWTRVSCTAGRFFASEPPGQSLSGCSRCSWILPDKLYLEKQCLDGGGHLLLTIHSQVL